MWLAGCTSLLHSGGNGWTTAGIITLDKEFPLIKRKLLQSLVHLNNRCLPDILLDIVSHGAHDPEEFPFLEEMHVLRRLQASSFNSQGLQASSFNALWLQASSFYSLVSQSSSFNLIGLQPSSFNSLWLQATSICSM